MLDIPIMWRRNAVTVDMVEIMTSPHPMWSLFILPGVKFAQCRYYSSFAVL